MRRVVVRRFRDFGVLVDANDADRPEQREPFAISDLVAPGTENLQIILRLAPESGVRFMVKLQIRGCWAALAISAT